jgi:hypothetical protein
MRACTQYRFAHKHILCFFGFAFLVEQFVGRLYRFDLNLTQHAGLAKGTHCKISSIDVAAYNALRDELLLAV